MQDFMNSVLDEGLEHQPRVAYALRAENLARRIAIVIKNLWTIDGADLPDSEPMERLTEAYFSLRRVSMMEEGELHEEYALEMNLAAVRRWFEFVRDDIHAVMLMLPPKPSLMDAAAELDMLILRLARRMA